MLQSSHGPASLLRQKKTENINGLNGFLNQRESGIPSEAVSLLIFSAILDGASNIAGCDAT